MWLPNDKTKRKQHRGEGHGADYKPWIMTREMNSWGTCFNPVDWKTHRSMQLLSTAEFYFYYLIRWNDNVLDIREQFPLELQETEQIAAAYGICHPSINGENKIMTTDMLVDVKDQLYPIAFNIKASRKELTKRDKEKQFIEKMYWNRRHVIIIHLYKEDLTAVHINTVNNVRRAVKFYDISKVRTGDLSDQAKFMVANKFIDIDLTQERLSFKKLGEEIFTRNMSLWGQVLVQIGRS